MDLEILFLSLEHRIVKVIHLFNPDKVAQERMLKVTHKRVRKSAAEVPDALQSRGFE